MRSDAPVDVYHDRASASKLPGASRTEVWDSRAHHPRPLICHSPADKDWGHSHPPLYSTLSALCYNSMPIPLFQSVPQLCLFYASPPQGIMPGHHLNILPRCFDKDLDHWHVSIPICLSTLSATVLCLAVRQFPSESYAWASFDTACLDKDCGHWHVSVPICLSTLSATIRCLAVRHLPAGHALAPPHMSQHLNSLS